MAGQQQRRSTLVQCGYRWSAVRSDGGSGGSGGHGGITWTGVVQVTMVWGWCILQCTNMASLWCCSSRDSCAFVGHCYVVVRIFVGRSILSRRYSFMTYSSNKKGDVLTQTKSVPNFDILNCIAHDVLAVHCCAIGAAQIFDCHSQTMVFAVFEPNFQMFFRNTGIF